MYVLTNDRHPVNFLMTKGLASQVSNSLEIFIFLGVLFFVGELEFIPSSNLIRSSTYRNSIYCEWRICKYSPFLRDVYTYFLH